MRTESRCVLPSLNGELLAAARINTDHAGRQALRVHASCMKAAALTGQHMPCGCWKQSGLVSSSSSSCMGHGSENREICRHVLDRSSGEGAGFRGQRGTQGQRQPIKSAVTVSLAIQGKEKLAVCVRTCGATEVQGRAHVRTPDRRSRRRRRRLRPGRAGGAAARSADDSYDESIDLRLSLLLPWPKMCAMVSMDFLERPAAPKLPVGF